MPASPNALKAWVLASRPKTLIASISPVVIAISLAAKIQAIEWDFALFCLLFSLSIQIGANLANDYFDYIKGADTSDRIGPPRAAQSGWISLPSLKKGIFFAFTMATMISLPLLARGGLWGSSLVALAILFAVLYTGGPKPLGYLGLGEVLVFFFYGPIATLGTYYILTFQIDPTILYASLPPGLLSCAILIANNLRDEESDRKANKKTLVVRYGNIFGRWEYVCTIGLAALIPLWAAVTGRAPSNWAFCSLILLAAYPALKRVFTTQNPQELALLLPSSAKLLYLYTALFCIANG
jgi:1,4-dihydroxy-2-naphthoate octaprenyltransferase